MKLFITTLFVLSSISLFALSSKKISKQEYVNQWSDVAVHQMIEFGIPASITMAQAILESASGNSDLARNGNNHFGIKCHGWKGKKMYKDDDKKDDCFRVYKNADESFKDHSDFLRKYNRYAFLFDYKSTDYKSWAKGLKKAGYATNPKYPSLLIKIIEELDLNELDKLNGSEILPQPQIAESAGQKKKTSISVRQHSISTHAVGVDYVVVDKGDTYCSIAKEFGMTLNQLYRFNDFSAKKDFLEVGDLIYIQKKKSRNLFKKEEVVLRKEMSVNELSQIHAVKAKTVLKLNKLTDANAMIAKGKKVTLR